MEGGGEVRKKGKPKPGESRKLTLTEVKLTKLKHGTLVVTGDFGEFTTIPMTEGDDHKNIRIALKKLFAYWAEDNGNGK